MIHLDSFSLSLRNRTGVDKKRKEKKRNGTGDQNI